MSDSTSLFTKELSPGEWDLLASQIQPIGRGLFIHPRLYMFAMQVKYPEAVEEELAAYQEILRNCHCWYCEAVRPLRTKAGTVTMYDVWLKQLMWTNGPIGQQLN